MRSLDRLTGHIHQSISSTPSHSIILHSSYHPSTFILTPFATISALIHSFSFTHTLSFPSLINKIVNLISVLWSCTLDRVSCTQHTHFLYLRRRALIPFSIRLNPPTFDYSLPITHTHTRGTGKLMLTTTLDQKKAAPVSSQRQGKLVRAVRGCVCPWYKMAVIYWFHSITMYMYNILQFFFAEFYFLFFVFICTRFVFFFCSFNFTVLFCTHTPFYAPILRGTQLVTQNLVALKLQNILLCKQSSRSTHSRTCFV